MQFDRPIGSYADVNELLYIATLHQTGETFRKDASVLEKDIQLFLKSRYGIVISIEDVHDIILNGLTAGGGAIINNNENNKNDNEKNDNENNNSNIDSSSLDIMEIMTILLIPILLKSAKQQQNNSNNNNNNTKKIDFDSNTISSLGIQPPPNDLLSIVLKAMIEDVTTMTSCTTILSSTNTTKTKDTTTTENIERNNGETSSSSTTTILLTTNLIKHIFEAYGEFELAQNQQLLQEMVDCCSNNNTNTTNTELNVETFAKALTYDVTLYDIRNEVRMTSNYDDVFLSDIIDNASSTTNNSVTLHSNTDNNKDINVKDTTNGYTQSERNLLYTPIEIQERIDSSVNVESVFTYPAIDNSAGTYRSRSLMVFLWACTLITYFAYWIEFARWFSGNIICNDNDNDFVYVLDSPWKTNSSAIACQFGLSVIRWLIFFFAMSVFGVLCIGLSSIGNNIHCRHWIWPTIGAITVLLMTIVPFAITMSSSTNRDNDDSGSFYLMLISLFLGMIVCAYHIGHIASLITPKSILQNYPQLRKLLNPHKIRSEGNNKRAVAYKVNKMVENALTLLQNNTDKDILTSNFGRALYSYTKSNQRTESVGGFRWAWSRIRDKSIYYKEGVWFSARLLASNVCQFIVALFILFEWINLTKIVANEYNKDAAQDKIGTVVDFVINNQVNEELVGVLVARTVSEVLGFVDGTDTNTFNCSSTDQGQAVIDEFCNFTPENGWVCDADADVEYLCALVAGDVTSTPQRMALLSGSGFDIPALQQTAQNILQEAANESIDSLYPNERYMFLVPLSFGLITAFLVALNLSISYIPSITSTILKLRTGVIPLVQNKSVELYRTAPETVAYLSGSLFWGALTASTVTGGVVATIIFLFVWQTSAYIAQRLVAVMIGIGVIALIRIILVRSFRVRYYEGFYRKRPGAANLAVLALEWASFALSTGFIFVRMVKLLFVAGFSIGRIDRPFLAEGLGQIGPIELDDFPTIFLLDILAHESHRHPYIELLGTMYLMKLRYREKFGKTAGSAWRLLFVYALMPWLHNYRIATRPNLKMSQALKNNDEDDENDENGNSLTYNRNSLISSISNSPWLEENNNSNNNNDTYARISLVVMEEAKIRALINAEREYYGQLSKKEKSIRRLQKKHARAIVKASLGVRLDL